MADTFDKVKFLIIDLGSVDRKLITPESRLREDFNIDSNAIYEIGQTIVNPKKGKISVDEVEQINTVGELVQKIDQVIKEAEKGGNFLAFGCLIYALLAASLGGYFGYRDCGIPCAIGWGILAPGMIPVVLFSIFAGLNYLYDSIKKK